MSIIPDIEKKAPKTFMGPAYVLEKEPGVYAMYRNITVEKDGKREPMGNPIGPMFLFRVAKEDELVDFVTGGKDGEMIHLHRFFPARTEAELEAEAQARLDAVEQALNTDENSQKDPEPIT